MPEDEIRSAVVESSLAYEGDLKRLLARLRADNDVLEGEVAEMDSEARRITARVSELQALFEGVRTRRAAQRGRRLSRSKGRPRAPCAPSLAARACASQAASAAPRPPPARPPARPHRDAALQVLDLFEPFADAPPPVEDSEEDAAPPSSSAAAGTQPSAEDIERPGDALGGGAGAAAAPVQSSSGTLAPGA